MKISVWEDNRLRNVTIEEFEASHMKRLWFDVTDPSVEDLERVAEALSAPRNALLGKLSSNYPHVDSYPEYTKIFAWYLNTNSSGKDLTSDMGPVIVFTNGQSVVSISQTWTQTSKAISRAYESPRYAQISHTARVAYLALDHVLESCEHFVDSFESQAEKLEDQNPPWPRAAYMEAFIIQRESSSLLRQVHHLKRLAEALTDDHTELGINEIEKRLFDLIQERATGAEEMTGITHETMQDLIGMHMDTLSHDMNKTMRLIAALTVIIGVPSLISTLLGVNLAGTSSGAFPLVEITASGVSMALLGIFFYVKGWLKLN
jgi:Mg2+ and Co2+ transporter CorA